jgi:hypothetical protein
LKAFWNRHRKLHIWLAADLVLLAAFFLTRGQRAWMNALASHVTGPLRRRIGDLCYRTDVSVMEVLCGILAVFTAVYMISAVVLIVRG